MSKRIIRIATQASESKDIAIRSRLFVHRFQILAASNVVITVLILALSWALVREINPVASANRPTPTPTYPPVPEQMQTLDKLLQVDPECLSPCWWGYVLGESLANDWYDFLEVEFGKATDRFRFERGERTLDVELSDKELIYATAARIRLAGEYDEITELSISYQPVAGPSGYNEYPMGYSLSNVIAAYGIPTQVWIGKDPLNPGIYLLYENYNLLIAYNFRPSAYPPFEPNWDEQNIWIYPKIETLFWLHIQAFAPDYPSTFESIEGNQYLFPIAELTEFNPETFAEAILDDPEFCLEVPLEIE